MVTVALLTLPVWLDGDVIRYGNAVLAFLGTFLLAAGLVVEWSRLWRPWRRVVVALLAQQLVIAYASIEAARASEAASVPARVYGYTGSLIAVLLAAGLAFHAHNYPGPEEEARGIRHRDGSGS